MKIKCITDILNFRFNSKYPNWPLSCSKSEISILNDVPAVHKYFRAFFTQRGVFYNKTRLPYIYCAGPRLGLLLEDINNLDVDKSRGGVLVVAGSDCPLGSKLSVLEKLKPYFSKIYYEVKNVECDWVQTIPMGMMMPYMLRNGGNKVILPQINKKKSKPKLIASAFGSKWPHLTNTVKDRRKLKNFTENSSFMDNMFCNPVEYYERLCDYKFFACPLGNGNMQTPKICECIMCETVPVVTNHIPHREMRDIYGLPLLIVDDWTDLTEAFLNEQWAKGYSRIDWDKQKSKFLIKNFNKLLSYNEIERSTSTHE